MVCDLALCVVGWVAWYADGRSLCWGGCWVRRGRRIMMAAAFAQGRRLEGGGADGRTRRRPLVLHMGCLHAWHHPCFPAHPILRSTCLAQA